MMTVRQIEKLWCSRLYSKLSEELLVARPESALRDGLVPLHSTTAAALGVICLDELNQSAAPICRTLLGALIASQQTDGGWRDPITSALVLRALLVCKGQGAAIDRGIEFLAHLQKEDGAWPSEPIRRLHSDAMTTVGLLFELGSEPRFRDAVRFDQAMDWVSQHEPMLDDLTRRLWQRACVRSRFASQHEISSQPVFAWS